MWSPFTKPIDGGGSKSTRPFTMCVVLGRPGGGKSTLTDAWIEEALRQGRDVRILDPNGGYDGGEWPTQGADDVRPASVRAEEWLLDVKRERCGPRGKNLPPCLLVLDDADLYCSGGQPRDVMRDLLCTFRHWRVDVIIVARRTQDLPKLVLTSAQWCVLFSQREVYAKQYLREYVGSSAVKRIPDEPFKFVAINPDTDEIVEGQTKKRAVRTAADGDV